MALTKITANIIEDGAISTASLADTSITADKLHTTLDLTGKTITVATATAGDNDTTVASTAFVSTAIANLADSAPATLDTLNELAAALGDDANFSTTVTNSIALKAPLASPDFTGTVTADGLTVDGNTKLNGSLTVNGNVDTSAILGEVLQLSQTDSVGGFLWSADRATNTYKNMSYHANVHKFLLDSTTEAMRINSSGNVGIGTDGPIAPLTINDNLASASNNTHIFVKNPSAEYTNGDPYISNAAPDGILVTANSSRTDGPDKMGLVLYNDDATAGGFSPMLLFAKRETGSTPYRSSMAGIYAKAPTGTGDSDAWIDGQLHFATAGASTEGIKSRMVIDKEGKVGIGITNPGQKLTVDGNIEMTSGSSRRIFMGGYGGGTFGLAYDLANSDYGIFYTEGTPVDVVNISPNGNSTAGAMTIYGNSRVGIGTTSANAGLTVSSGDIRATAAAFGNDANSISMSWEGSNGGYITARGPSTSQKGTIGLSVNQSNGGGGTIGLQIDSSGRATTPSNPAFRARATSAQSLANGWAQVGYDTLIQSRGTGYNTTTSRFTAPVAGWYQFNAQWSAANSGDADGTMSFWINGSATDLVGSVSMPDTGGTYDGHSISGCCYLAVGDFVQVHRYSTVATTTRTSVYYGGWFSGFLIG